MTKRRPLALGAAAAIGFGSLFIASPAIAVEAPATESNATDQTATSQDGSFSAQPIEADAVEAQAAEQPAPDPVPEDELENILMSPQVTPADLQDSEIGVKVEVYGAEPGTEVSDSLTGETNEANDDGIATWVIYSTGEVEVGKQSVDITYTRKGESEPTTISTSFEVVEEYSNDEPPADFADLTVDSVQEGDEIPVMESPSTFSGTGEPGASIDLELHSGDSAIEPTTGEAVVEEDGSWTVDMTNPLDAGDWSITVTQLDQDIVIVDTVTVGFTVVPLEDPDLSGLELAATPTELTATEFDESGVEFTADGLPDTHEFYVTVDAIGDEGTEQAIEAPVEVSAEGTGTATLDNSVLLDAYRESHGDKLEAGEYSATLWYRTSQSSSASAGDPVSITVTGDTPEEPAEYALSVSPQEITAADFVNQDKGVALTVEGAEAGEEIAFAVAPSGSSVEPLEETAEADENGVATWNVYGLDDSEPAAYVGDYSVTATNAAGEELTGAFTVTAGDDDGGNDDGGDDNGGSGDGGDDNGNGGSDEGDLGGSGGDLADTGAETSALPYLLGAAGLALAGGASLLIARRRRSVEL